MRHSCFSVKAAPRREGGNTIASCAPFSLCFRRPRRGQAFRSLGIPVCSVLGEQVGLHWFLGFGSQRFSPRALGTGSPQRLAPLGFPRVTPFCPEEGYRERSSQSLFFIFTRILGRTGMKTKNIPKPQTNDESRHPAPTCFAAGVSGCRLPEPGGHLSLCTGLSSCKHVARDFSFPRVPVSPREFE